MKKEMGDIVKIIKPKYFSEKVEKGQLLKVLHRNVDDKISLRDEITESIFNFIPEKAVKVVEKDPPKYIRVVNTHSDMIGKIYPVEKIEKHFDGSMSFIVLDIELNSRKMTIEEHDLVLSTKTEYENQEIKRKYNKYILNKKDISIGSFAQINDEDYKELNGKIGVVKKIDLLKDRLTVSVNEKYFKLSIFSLTKMDSPKYIIDSLNCGLVEEEEYIEGCYLKQGGVYVKVDENRKIKNIFKVNVLFYLGASIVQIIDFKTKDIKKDKFTPEQTKCYREATSKEIEWFDKCIKENKYIPFTDEKRRDIERIVNGNYYSITNEKTGQYSIFLAANITDNKEGKIIIVEAIAEIDKNRMIMREDIVITKDDIIKEATKEEKEKFNIFLNRPINPLQETLEGEDNKSEHLDNVLKAIVKQKNK